MATARAATVVTALALLLPAAGGAEPGSRPLRLDDPATAFGRLVRQRYGDEPGAWACKRLVYPPRRVACLAVLRRGATLTEVRATTPAPPAAPAFADLSITTRTRRWRPLPAKVVHGVDAMFRTSASANAPLDRFDWAWLVAAAHSAKLPASVIASDGPSDEPDLVIRFRCERRGRDIVCTNAVGDSLRLRPSR